LELLEERLMTAFAAAGPDRLPVHTALPAALKLFGEQVSELSELAAGAISWICAVRATPLRVAVTVAIWLEGITPAVTANDPLLAPAPMEIPAGVDSAALSSERTIEAPPAEALVRVTVQFAVWPLFKVPGAQVSEERADTVVKVRIAFWVPPFRLALIKATSSAGTPVIVAENCAVLCPARTVTDAGVVMLALLSEIATVAFVAAVAVRVTVQVVLPAALKLLGEQASELRLLGAGAANPTCVERVTPLRLAVMVAVCADAMFPAVTENDALLAPFATFTLPGAGSVPLSELRLIVATPTDALFNEAVQDELWPLFKLPGVQVNDASDAGAVRVSVAFCVPPFRLALIKATSSAGTPVIEAENWALLCPDRTVTELGVVMLALLSETPTVAFAAAGAVSDTVQVVLPAALKLFGEHESELNTLGVGGTRPTEAVRVTPLRLAVMVAV
jgi:hypothetical protein